MNWDTAAGYTSFNAARRNDEMEWEDDEEEEKEIRLEHLIPLKRSAYARRAPEYGAITKPLPEAHRARFSPFVFVLVVATLSAGLAGLGFRRKLSRHHGASVSVPLSRAPYSMSELDPNSLNEIEEAVQGPPIEDSASMPDALNEIEEAVQGPPIEEEASMPDVLSRIEEAPQGPPIEEEEVSMPDVLSRIEEAPQGPPIEASDPAEEYPPTPAPTSDGEWRWAHHPPSPTAIAILVTLVVLLVVLVAIHCFGDVLFFASDRSVAADFERREKMPLLGGVRVAPLAESRPSSYESFVPPPYEPPAQDEVRSQQDDDDGADGGGLPGGLPTARAFVL